MGDARPFAGRRHELGLSQQQAAAALGITSTYLSRLERGHVPLSLRLARRMAEIYRCPIRHLVRRGR